MALTKKNIIVGAARIYLGPSIDQQAGSTFDAKYTVSKPAYVANTRYSTTMAGANGSTNTGVGTAVANWNEVGYTQDGLEVATDPSWAEVEVDQLLDSAKIFKDGMTVNISTTFAEATLENLLIAWGQAANTISSISATEKEIRLTGGALGEFPLERGLVAIGNAPENVSGNSYGERVYQAFRVISVEAVSIANSRSEATTIPVTFRALPADNGDYGVFRDRLNVT